MNTLEIIYLLYTLIPRIVGYTLASSYALIQTLIHLCCYCQHKEKSCENTQKSSLVSELETT